MDFAETRRYSPGDDIRLIDWRVTARTGDPHTKLFREERERPVFVVVDLNASMFFGTRGAFKSVVAAECAALICWAAVAGGDRIGAVLVTPSGNREVRPASGRRGALRVLKSLAACAHPVAADRQPVSAALLNLRRVARPGSLIFVISDFYTLDSALERHLSRLRHHNDVLACWIYDRVEAHCPPPGRYVVSDGAARATLDLASAGQRRAYEGPFLARRERLTALCLDYRIPLLPIATGDDVVASLRQGLLGTSPAARAKRSTGSRDVA